MLAEMEERRLKEKLQMLVYQTDNDERVHTEISNYLHSATMVNKFSLPFYKWLVRILLNSKGWSLTMECQELLHFPHPVISEASIMLICNAVTHSWVPWHNLGGSKFISTSLISLFSTAIYESHSEVERFNEFKNSVE